MSKNKSKLSNRIKEQVEDLLDESALVAHYYEIVVSEKRDDVYTYFSEKLVNVMHNIESIAKLDFIKLNSKFGNYEGFYIEKVKTISRGDHMNAQVNIVNLDPDEDDMAIARKMANYADDDDEDLSDLDELD